MRRVKLIGLTLAYTALLTATILDATGCANITSKLPKLPNGQVDVVKLLTWTMDGVNEACTREWLNQPTCFVAQDAINLAVAVAKAHQGDKDPKTIYAAVLKSLQDSAMVWGGEEGKLRDFFNWVILLLEQLSGQPPTPLPVVP